MASSSNTNNPVPEASNTNNAVPQPSTGNQLDLTGPLPVDPFRYGGLCLEPLGRKFLQCAPIEPDGIIERPPPGMMTLVSNTPASLKHTRARICEMSKAAGLLTIVGPNMPTLSVSGFWIEGGDRFLTHNHFLLHTWQGSSGMEGKHAVVMSTRSTRNHQYDLQARKVFLGANAFIDGIAIWYLMPGVEKVIDFIYLDQLVAFNDNGVLEDRFASDLDLYKLPLFGVGFNSPEDTGVYEALTAKMVMQLWNQDPKPAIYRSVPNFHKMFLPNERVLSMGRLLKIPDMYPGWRLCEHSVSGWLGFSGAMMGFVMGNERGAQKGPPKVRLCGIFRGGALDAEHNLMVPFTTSFLKVLRQYYVIPGR
ncbi:hypothetical protein TWF696_004522 [Orbilia brochopaga]|uniref:Uncharacterized protein n=1 Tax=Orbilia brochopaga TaxID=3140254 RepID=A0AAV9V735_9PEZI